MKEAVSCGGVVIYRGKVLLLFKNYHDRYHGWVLPKGTVEPGEEFTQTAQREVKEEAGSDAKIIKYIGDTNYQFKTGIDQVNKTVHWYLMAADSYFCKPQKEEYFTDSGFYKYHEAIYLLKYENERAIFESAYKEFLEMRKSGTWINN